MSRRIDSLNWPLVLVSAIAVVAVVGAIVVGVAAGDGFSAVAYTVNDTKVSQHTVDGQLRSLADHNAFSGPVFGANNVFKTSSSAVSGAGSASWLTIQIELDVVHTALAERGAAPSKAQLAAARTSLLANFAQAQVGVDLRSEFGKLPRSLQDDVVEFVAVQSVVKASTVLNAAVVKALRRADVSVDPKYGFWSAKRQEVCPPTGCPRATASSGSSSSGG